MTSPPTARHAKYMPRRASNCLPSAAPNGQKLTLLQSRFCEEFTRDWNATAAARRAGYADETQGRHVIALSHVQDHIAALTRARLNRLTASVDSVLRKALDIADFDILDLYREDGTLRPPQEWPVHARPAIAGIETEEHTETRTETAPDGTSTVTIRTTVVTRKVKTRDIQASLKLLAQHLGMLDRHDTVALYARLDVEQARADARPALADPVRRSALLAFAGLPGDGPLTVEALPTPAPGCSVDPPVAASPLPVTDSPV